MSLDARVFEFFAFAIDDKVTVKGAKVPGVVTGILLYALSTQYRVVYWVDEKRYDEWLLEDEIEAT